MAIRIISMLSVRCEACRARSYKTGLFRRKAFASFHHLTNPPGSHLPAATPAATLVLVDLLDLTPEQVERTFAIIDAKRRWCEKLVKRFDELSVPADDSIRKAAEKALR